MAVNNPLAAAATAAGTAAMGTLFSPRAVYAGLRASHAAVPYIHQAARGLAAYGPLAAGQSLSEAYRLRRRPP
jgi:hypothetical protein